MLIRTCKHIMWFHILMYIDKSLIPQRPYYTHRKTAYLKPTFRLSIKTISSPIPYKPKHHSTVKSPWSYHGSGNSKPLAILACATAAFLHLLDLLGFPCAQNRHATNHIWTMGEILRRIKRAYWSEKSVDNKKRKLR